ncbi:MAG: redoxin domain-containing protein [Candidatus Lambdaproteobacteria bacterium]|nr:redoxin domain-containing protein [Candidatus Lambdaproteobacteria bacterium]
MWRSWKFWTVMVAISGLVVMLAYGFFTDPKKVPSPLVGHMAPDFAVERLGGGEKLSLGSLRGTPVILNFWASWCLACRDEAHLLEAVHREYGVEKKALRVIGIAVQDDVQKAQAFARQYRKTYFLALDNAQGEISLNYGLYGVPETFFIDREGMIRYKQIGALTPAVMEAQVPRLIAGVGSGKAKEPK